MKKLLIIFHFSFFVFHFSYGQQYGWTDISGNLPDYPFDTVIINNGADTGFAHISDISFINDYEGWVTTWHAFSDQNAAILHTTDDGGTWEVQTVMRPCQVIHMVDENVGYAGSEGGLLFKTIDGGQNWNYDGITGAPITGMSFVPGSDTGYVCSYMSSSMQQITPGGVNNISLGIPDWWHSISAPSHNLIWMSGGNSVWTFDEDGLTDQPISSTWYNSIDFVRNDLGWGVGNDGVKGNNPGTISGCLGKNIPWVHLKYTEKPLYEVFALDENHVWAAGVEGYIYYSENASQFDRDTITGSWWSNVTFVSQPNPRPDVDVLSLFFTSPQNGFASGEKNVLLKYGQINGEEEYGGLGSAEVYPNPTKGQFSIHLPSARSAFKVESKSVEVIDIYGKILKTQNPEPGTRHLELDVSHLPTGLYFLRFNADYQVIVKKFIKL
jgi:hypothetical protein